MDIAVLKLITDRKFTFREVEKFRGFIGNFFQDEVLFHNHVGDYQLLYKSSQIQYKLIDGYFAVVGIGEGAALIEERRRYLKILQIGESFVKVKDQDFVKSEYQLKILDEMVEYTFLENWFALNSDNYEKYRNNQLDLNKQLQNNIIEFFKMSNVWADKPIEAKGVFSQETSTSKGVKIITFKGTFKCNVNLPDYIGLGKRKSIGYGTIKKI